PLLHDLVSEYCNALVHLRRVQAEMLQSPLVFRCGGARHGEQIKVNPVCAVLDQAAARFRAVARQLGLQITKPRDKSEATVWDVASIDSSARPVRARELDAVGWRPG